ncbi:MAG TPA: alpha/beta fold hydrolase [Burkholderiaceae bacterium]|nr:alpha/beta fold hydrolase [Burkholderiaceae bacterium]
MLARGLRIANLVVALATSLLAWTVHRMGHDWPAAIALALLLPLGLQALPLALEFATGALVDRRAGDRLGPIAGLRLWLGETWHSLRLFNCDQVWRAGFPEPAVDRDPARPAVLLIHGYMCNRAVWREWLPRMSNAANVATLNLEPVFGPIEGYAERIAQAVERLRAASGAPRVTIVAHSMGGLATRAYLRRHGAAAVAQVITLATPHHGTVFARLGLGRNARQMRPGSDFLRTLNGTTEPVPFTCIAAGDDNLIVPRSSPLLPGAAAIRIERVGHLALLGDERALQATLDRLR